MMSFYKPMLAAVIIGLIAGCSTVESVPPPDGDDEYVLACTKTAGKPGCKAQAKAVCPNGYKTLSSEENFERKELRIQCSEAQDSAR